MYFDIIQQNEIPRLAVFFKIFEKGDYDLVNSIKPGTDNQKPGHYVEVGPRGGSVPKGHTATIGKGDRLPPTSTKGNGWKKV